MHLVICIILLGGGGLSQAYPRPTPIDMKWSPFVNYREPQNYKYIGPALMGEIVNPRVVRHAAPGGVFDGIIKNGLQQGFNFFDNIIPPVYESAVRPIDHREAEELKKFNRLRRQENKNSTQLLSEQGLETGEIQQAELFTTIITPTTETIAIVTPIPITPSVTTVATTKMENKMDSAVLTPRPDTVELEAMLKQLNNALHYIQEHGNEKIHEEITNKTSTEKIVQFISNQVEILSKSKNHQQRAMKIKQITKALDILLNRIAKSAKPLLPLKSSSEDQNRKPDPILMARIVQHVAELKKHALNDKVNNGYELTSAELDGGLPARFRPVRQRSEESNNIDNDDEDDDNKNKDVEAISSTTAKPLEVTAKQEENSDQQSSSQEGGGNLVANLLSSFLGSLSTPEGGVDVDAIVALVSGLSVQRDDGSFDFSGITELLQSFVGDDEEGGSDVGAFLGGLIGATLQGFANPPGAKGTGRLTGNLIANILPGLSAPAPPSSSEQSNTMQHSKPIDSGSFLAGLLTSMLGSSSGSSSGGGWHPMNGADNHKMGSADFFVKVKQHVFHTIFGLITSVLGASSGGISHASGASSGSSSGKFSGKH